MFKFKEVNDNQQFFYLKVQSVVNPTLRKRREEKKCISAAHPICEIRAVSQNLPFWKNRRTNDFPGFRITLKREREWRVGRERERGFYLIFSRLQFKKL